MCKVTERMYNVSACYIIHADLKDGLGFFSKGLEFFVSCQASQAE